MPSPAVVLALACSDPTADARLPACRDRAEERRKGLSADFEGVPDDLVGLLQGQVRGGGREHTGAQQHIAAGHATAPLQTASRLPQTRFQLHAPCVPAPGFGSGGSPGQRTSTASLVPLALTHAPTRSPPPPPSQADLRTVSYEDSKYLGGDIAHTHLVKGLDFALLQKVGGAPAACGPVVTGCC